MLMHAVPLYIYIYFLHAVTSQDYPSRSPVSLSLPLSKAQPARLSQMNAACSCLFPERLTLGSPVYMNQAFQCAANYECDVESLSLQTEL